MRFICCYRPPSNDHQYNRLLIDTLRNLVDCPSYVICGDFNFPDISWNPPVASQNISKDFLRFIQIEGIKQIISEPTHHSGNILDLVLTSDKFLINSLHMGPPMSTSDHCTIAFDVNVGVSQNVQQTHNFNKLDRLKGYLSNINWNFIFENCNNVEDFWLEFKNCLNHGIQNCVPKFNDRKKSRRLFPICRRTQEALRLKCSLWSRFKRLVSSSDKSAYNRVAKLCKTLVISDTIFHENKVVTSTSRSKFYSCVKASLKDQQLSLL